MFSYNVPYRAESKDFVYPVLRGAAQLESNKWIFYASESVDPVARVFTFKNLKRAKNGTIIGLRENDSDIVFSMVTMSDVKSRPSEFELDAESVAFIKRPSDLNLLLVAAEIPDWYEQMYGPVDDVDDVDDEDISESLMEAAFVEARGIPAQVGDIHKWSDGFEYEKKDVGWRRIPSDWQDTHPDIPQSTKNQFHSEIWGWDPHRKNLHTKLLSTVRSEAFAGKKPAGPDETPSFTYIMGPPAAGKSTRTRSPEYNNIVKLDPDEFVERMPEFQRAKEVKARNGASAVVEEALMLNDVLVDEAMEGRYNFIIAGTGSSLDWIERAFFPALKKRGYRINVLMTYVEDADELLKRSEARGHRTGRFVPPERTKELHSRLPRNFKRLTQNPDINAIGLINSHLTADSVENSEVYWKSGDKEQVVDQRYYDDFLNDSQK